MRIRIDIDISAAELTAWLESIVAAPKPVASSPTEVEDTLAAESRALDSLINWAKGRVKGGGHA